MNSSSEPCSRRREDISLLAVGALTEREKVELENHLSTCPNCQQYFDEVKAVSARLADCQSEFAQVEPSLAAQNRWADAIHSAAEKSPSLASVLQTFCCNLWLEVLWPCRRAVTGVAAVWLLIWVANSAMFTSPAGISMARSRTAPGAWQEFVAQRQFLAELMGSKSVPPAEPPRRGVLRPRGEGLSEIKFC